MIETSTTLSWMVRLAAPFAWRSRLRTARKLQGFSATEAGSALDMLKAAELCDDPHLRRLFFKHAVDEARHAEMFRNHARMLVPGSEGDAYAHLRATRQNLYQGMDLVEFVAFVHHAEEQGQTHFAALARHFRDQPLLRTLFLRIERDERFHVGYSAKLLRQWSAAGRAREVRRARRSIAWKRAWGAWRRAGRQLADVVGRATLAVVWLLCVPPFALAQRLLEPERTGWKSHERRRLGADDLGRMS